MKVSVNPACRGELATQLSAIDRKFKKQPLHRAHAVKQLQEVVQKRADLGTGLADLGITALMTLLVILPALRRDEREADKARKRLFLPAASVGVHSLDIQKQGFALAA